MRNRRRRVYKSGFEGRAQQEFKARGIEAHYETTKLAYTISAIYTPDFTCGDILVETKGYFDSEDRRKMRAVRESNPDLDIRIWFQKDGWLTKAKKGKYSDWAKKHGFECWVGEAFPDHWFDSSNTK